MGINNTELGELVAMGNLVQRNVNEHQKALNELQPLLRRLSILTKPVPLDEFGDELTNEELAKMIQKTKDLCKKCEKYLTLKDSSAPKDEE